VQGQSSSWDAANPGISVFHCLKRFRPGGSYTLGKGLPLIPSIVEMSGKFVSGGGLHFF
jgi:hypothetical protein